MIEQAIGTVLCDGTGTHRASKTKEQCCDLFYVSRPLESGRTIAPWALMYNGENGFIDFDEWSKRLDYSVCLNLEAMVGLMS